MDDKLSMLTEEGMAIAIEYTLDKVKECRTAALNEVREIAKGQMVDVETYGRGKTYGEERNAVLENFLALLTNLEKGK